MKSFCKTYLVVAVLLTSIAYAQTPLSPENTTGPVRAAQTRRVLTMRERAKFGLTIPNVARAVRQLREEKQIDDETTDSEIAAAVLSKLQKENSDVYGAAAKADRDWASFLEAAAAFIERILPLILQIIAKV